MANPQHPSGQAESPISDPGTHSNSGLSAEPTLHEFLTRLVSDPAARSAFDADPQATLDQVGLGEMSATDVLQATSLVLDYAPVEVVNAYDRSLSSSVEKFAASNQHVAISELHPAHPHEQEELSMLQNTPSDDFGPGGDVDAQLPAPAPAPSGDTNVDIEHNDVDSHNVVNVHDVLSGNQILSGNTVNIGDNLDLSSTVGSVTSTATHVFDSSLNVASAAGSLVHGDVTNVVGDVASGNVTDVVTNAPVVGDVAANVTQVVGDAPVVGDVVGDVTSGDVTGIAGDLTSTVSGGDALGVVAGLPVVGDVASTATSTIGSVPVVGDVAASVTSGDVTGVAGTLTDAGANVPVVGDALGDVTSGDVTGAVSNVPVVGEVADTATGALSNVPVVGDVAGGAAGGNLVNNVPVGPEALGDVTGTVTDAVANVPVAGDLASSVTDTVAGGDVTALPVDDLSSALPTDALPVEDVTSALPLDAAPLAPVGDVASHLPAPSDLPVAGPIVGEPLEDLTSTATDALPLDGLL